VPGSLISPWWARWGGGDYDDRGLLVATIALKNGRNAQAEQQFAAILAMLDRMEKGGEMRYGPDELRAEVLAQQGDYDGAMRTLTRAADRGWRRVWWAEHEPYLAPLHSRNDYRALIQRVAELLRPMAREVVGKS
jgi:hypothetical protein